MLTRFILICLSGWLFANPAVAATKTLDIILSANGAAAGNAQDYNAGSEFLTHSIDWDPGYVTDVDYQCSDNCKDLNKFDYQIYQKDGKVMLKMKAITDQKGLVRIHLTATVK
jgi:hypothetical protein